MLSPAEDKTGSSMLGFVFCTKTATSSLRSHMIRSTTPQDLGAGLGLSSFVTLSFARVNRIQARGFLTQNGGMYMRAFTLIVNGLSRDGSVRKFNVYFLNNIPTTSFRSAEKIFVISFLDFNSLSSRLELIKVLS